jgi:hypothetical protein
VTAEKGSDDFRDGWANRVVASRPGGIAQSIRRSLIRRWAPLAMTILLPAVSGVVVATGTPAAASTRLTKPGPPTAVTRGMSTDLSTEHHRTDALFGKRHPTNGGRNAIPTRRFPTRLNEAQ